MNNWTIKKRIIFGFSTVLGLVTILATVSFFMLREIETESKFLDTDALPGLEAIAEIKNSVSEIQLKTLRALLATNADDQRNFQKEIDERRGAIAALMQKYEKTMTLAEDREMFEKFKVSRDEYIAARAKLFQMVNAGQHTEATAFNVASLRPAYEVYQGCAERLFRFNADNASKASTRSRLINGRANLLIIGMSIAVIVLGVVLATAIVIGLNRVLLRLSGTLGDGSNMIVSAAGQVSAASQSLAEGASEQAASLEETSASVEELSSITKRNAENAQKANEIARQARTAADAGSADMQAMNQAMEAIKVSSDDIAKIIKTIDEIAFQTNILALNAAVEAARAGEAGMGFAVVADEVRNLAQRCAQSAKETSSKIEGAIARTAQGVELSAKVTRRLGEIVTQVRNVDELAAEVANASSEQSQGISQVSVAISQIDKVTQSNAANAEESASAAEEMNSQAAALRQAVNDLLRLTGGSHYQGVEEGGILPIAKAPKIPAKLPVSRNGHAEVHTHGHDRVKLHEPVLAAPSKSVIPMDDDFKNF